MLQLIEELSLMPCPWSSAQPKEAPEEAIDGRAPLLDRALTDDLLPLQVRLERLAAHDRLLPQAACRHLSAAEHRPHSVPAQAKELCETGGREERRKLTQGCTGIPVPGGLHRSVELDRVRIALCMLHRSKRAMP